MQLLNIQIIAIIQKVNLENSFTAKVHSCWLSVSDNSVIHYCCSEVLIICISICFTGLIFIPQKSHQYHYTLAMFTFIVIGPHVLSNRVTSSSS